MLRELDRFHKSITGYLLFGVIELALAYGLVSLAIDTGNLFYYLLTLIFLFGSLQNFFRLLTFKFKKRSYPKP
jgi:Na+/proline symporter